MGWRTTSASKPAIIGFLKNAIENEELWIPSPIIINELMTYISTDDGKTEAIPGGNDDTVIALAIALEMLRTHGDRLTNDRLPFNQKMGSQFQMQETVWL